MPISARCRVTVAGLWWSPEAKHVCRDGYSGIVVIIEQCSNWAAGRCGQLTSVNVVNFAVFSRGSHGDVGAGPATGRRSSQNKGDEDRSKARPLCLYSLSPKQRGAHGNINVNRWKKTGPAFCFISDFVRRKNENKKETYGKTRRRCF